MPGPWEQYQKAAPAAKDGPWTQYQSAEPESPGLEIDIVGGTLETDAQRMAREADSAKPSLFRADSDFTERTGLSQLDLAWPAAKDMFGSRKGAAETLAKKTGGTVEQDSTGAEVLALPDGTRYRLNDAGLDSTDIANVAGNIAALFTPAAWAARVAKARQMGLGGRALFQGGMAGGSDAVLQLGFDGLHIDPLRTAAATAGGGAGEVVGTALGAGARRFSEAGRAASGRNTAQARELVDEAGIVNPSTEQISRLSEAVPELRAGADPRALLGREEYGFTYTQGQRATDPVAKFTQLSREELLRQSPGGGAPFREMDRTNVDALGNALDGMGDRVGGRAGATPAELAQGAAQRLRGQADELDTRIGDAYAKAGRGARAAISADAVKGLPRILQTSVADFAPNPTTTPVAYKTLEQLRLASDTILKGAEGGKVSGVTLKALETQRRIINNNIDAAANKADRAAVVKIKREFDAWMDDAVDTSLISGDPAALQAIKEARGLRAEYGRRFEGGTESDKFIGRLLDGTRTPEELVNIALGTSQVSKAGGARFIDRLRAAAGNDPEIIGNLRAAHFLRLTRGNNGEPLQMGQLVRNIRTTEHSNASIVSALYPKEQWNEIRRLASALEPLIAKGDFAKSSGTAERMARMLFQRVGGFPLIGGIIKSVDDVKAGFQANAAINKPLKLRASPSRPIAPATLSATSADSTRN